MEVKEMALREVIRTELLTIPSMTKFSECDPEKIIYIYSFCENCGKIKEYGFEKYGATFSENHGACNAVLKFKKLSIFDKKSNEIKFNTSEVQTDEEGKFKKSFEKYCNNFIKAKEKGIGLLMTGAAGTGKTFYSYCIGNDLMTRGHTVLSFNLNGYLAEIRQGFDEKEAELLTAVKEAEFIVIDDLGSEVLTEWNKEKLFNLFDTIYRNKKAVCITSNMNGRALKEHLTFNGSDKIFDRILELAKPFKFNWTSRRGKKNEKNFQDIF